MLDSSVTAPQQLAPPNAASSWPQALLEGGSVNGRRLYERDWAKTAMGPIQSWPQSLRTTLLTCLESRSPTFVYWGRDFIQFYNDAGTKLMGAKDKPTAFGGPISESSPELWPSRGPMFQTVLTSGKATCAEDQLLWMERSGFVEETYLTWSYSPLRVESGEVGGIFCSVTEVTRQVVAERRLRLLRELATRCASKPSVEEACRECMAALGDNHPDLVFGELRMRIPGTDTPKVVESFGVVVPERSQTLPIVLSGDREPVGFLSIGLNPNRPYDDDYKSFVNLVAGQLAAALGNARSHEAALARTKELAQLDRAKSAFFSNVSHEFRTPLPLLLAPLEGALSRDLDAEKKARLAREEVRKLSILLDASPDHVFLIDQEGRFVYANRSAEESVRAHLANIGRAGEPVLNQSPRQMAFAPDFLAQFEADIASAFRGETAVGTVVFPSPLGPRHFEYILSRLPGEAGEAQNVLGITRDIQELKAAVKMRDEFLSVASHELKTPITSLSLQNQLRTRMLRSQAGIAPEKLMKMFGDDARQLHRLLRLVDDMLDSSRLESSSFQITRDDVELNRLVRDVVDRMAPELSTSGVEITVAQSADQVWGRWDRYRLEQVMGNLLTNAMKYGDGKPVTVTVRLLEDLAEVSVTDHGIGIAPTDQARVFDRFERAVNDKGVSGLGLGLFIVRQIVEAHGGRVRVESELSKGSTFTVELPRQLSSDHAAAAVAITAAPNAT